MFYWNGKGTNGWFWKTAEQLREETGLSYHEQLQARKNLKALGLLEERRDRRENKLYFRVNENKLNDLWESFIREKKSQHEDELLTFEQKQENEEGILRTNAEAPSNFEGVQKSDHIENLKVPPSNFEGAHSIYICNTNNFIHRIQHRTQRNVCQDLFEQVWRAYPNKVNKQRALQKFLATVKTGDDFTKFLQALKNYLSSERVANGYIKDGHRWFAEWQDWINPTTQMMGQKKNGRPNVVTEADIERITEELRNELSRGEESESSLFG
jgi:hypothetical protein